MKLYVEFSKKEINAIDKIISIVSDALKLVSSDKDTAPIEKISECKVSNDFETMSDTKCDTTMIKYSGDSLEIKSTLNENFIVDLLDLIGKFITPVITFIKQMYDLSKDDTLDKWLEPKEVVYNNPYKEFLLDKGLLFGLDDSKNILGFASLLEVNNYIKEHEKTLESYQIIDFTNNQILTEKRTKRI